MAIGDVVDAIGDGIDHGVKTMGRGIGKVVAGAAHVVGDGLDAVACTELPKRWIASVTRWPIILAPRSVSCKLGQTEDPPSWCTATSARSTDRSDI